VSGWSKDWLKMKNPDAPAVKREAEEDWRAAVIPFATSDEFYHRLGLFYAAWSRTDLVIDCAIWKALAVTPAQAHKRVAAMNFGRKCDAFRNLLPASTKFENIDEVKGLLTRITDHSMRNVFAHSFLASDEGSSVTFIHRERGQYRVKEHTFTRDQFLNHVDEFVQLSFDFQKAVGLSDWEVAGFGAAALSLASTPPSASP
jgi:hypothetical protein